MQKPLKPGIGKAHEDVDRGRMSRKRSRSSESSSDDLSLENVKYGANQSAITLRLREGTEPVKRAKKLEGMSAGAVVRGPRSYKDERTQQAQRHFATLLKAALIDIGADPREVQIGFKPDEIGVSTNTRTGNRELKKKIGDDESCQFNLLVEFALGRMPEKKESPRVGRHARKFRQSERQEQELLRIAAGGSILKVHIPEIGSEEDGEHAERLLYRDKFTDMKGTMRPCAHCYPVIMSGAEGADDHLGPGPGPKWLSNAASRKNTLKPSLWRTRLTRTRENIITYSVDTDSDSDYIEE